MSNQEQIDSINAKIKELQAEVDKLKAEPDTSELVFKPENGERFIYISGYGDFEFTFKDTPCIDNVLFSKGNCFRTEEDAKNSAKYYIMNSEYDYWFPWSGQPKPKVLPKGLEFWNIHFGGWDNSGFKNPSLLDNRIIYRWKRSEQ